MSLKKKIALYSIHFQNKRMTFFSMHAEFHKMVVMPLKYKLKENKNNNI